MDKQTVVHPHNAVLMSNMTVLTHTTKEMNLTWILVSESIHTQIAT